METREGWFVEGAWAGPFDKGELDAARLSAGTGGVVRGSRVVFCTPTDMIARLYSLRIGKRLFISNSMTFVLSMGRDEPDPYYPYYARMLREYQTAGISTTQKRLHTSRGHEVCLHEFCQLATADDLNPIRVGKPVYPRPSSLQDYLSTLKGMSGEVLQNAASPQRRQRYEGLATVSRGYDSNALTALSKEAGVRDALTLYRTVPGDDSGEEVARYLGINVRVYGSTDFRTMPALNEAEFFTWPDRTSAITFAPCEDQLVGKLLIMGQWGDKLFGMGPIQRYLEFRGSTYGCQRLLEFRLRTGFLNVNPLFAGGLHLQAMRAISSSPEMAPWRLGVAYDRPIARRILEEAGVPREAFGLGKAASPRYRVKSVADLTPASRADFESYLRSMPRSLLYNTWYRMLSTIRSGCEKTTQRVGESVSRTGGAALESLIPVPRTYRKWNSMAFTMHWAHARTRSRYDEAVARSQQS